MPLLRTFIAVELVAHAALLLLASFLAAYAAVESGAPGDSLISPAGSAWLVFAYTVVIGVGPVLFFGAPGYVMLLINGKANWLNTLTLAAVPGIVLLLVDGWLGVLAIGCSLVVAAATHLVCRRLAPNNSFKPKPLRGSA